MNQKLQDRKLTVHEKPGGRRLPVCAVTAFVGAFIRLGEITDGHVTCRGRPHKKGVFEKVCSARSRVVGSTAQSHVMALHQRPHRPLQKHRRTWRCTQTPAAKQLPLAETRCHCRGSGGQPGPAQVLTDTLTTGRQEDRQEDRRTDRKRKRTCAALTGDSDVEAVAAVSVSGLTPVGARVPRFDHRKLTTRGRGTAPV